MELNLLPLAQYVEINLIGVFILLVMLFYIFTARTGSSGADYKAFRQLLMSNAAILISDAIILVLRDTDDRGLFLLNHAMCVVYYLLHAYFGYTWLHYCINRLFPGYKIKRRLHLIISLPCLVSSLLVLVSPWTGWVYRIGERNIYMRGPLMWAVITLAYSYWLVSAVLVVRELIRQERNRELSLYITLLLFPCLTIIGNVIQLVNYGLSVVWICTAISLLTLFVDLQTKQLARDALTGLYNRHRADNQLTWEIEHFKSDSLLFAVVTDVDHFKGINDIYGHITRDAALRAVADILRCSADDDTFIGRLGGDEFLLVGHATDVSQVEELMHRIETATHNYNTGDNASYRISLSSGFAVFDSAEGLTVDGIISEADREMYKIKAEKNVSRHRL